MTLSPWVFWDQGKIGTFKQAKVLVEHLVPNGSYDDFSLTLPSRWIQGWMVPFLGNLLCRYNNLPSTIPSFIIAAGRWSSYVAYYYRFRCPVVLLLNSDVDQFFFPCMVVPSHDFFSNPSIAQYHSKIVTYTGALHEFTPSRLEFLSSQHHSWGQDFPHPWIGVVLGGNSRHISYSRFHAQRFIDDLQQWIKCHIMDQGASFLITSSRRTPLFFQEAVIDFFTHSYPKGSSIKWWFDSSKKSDVYPLMLAQSDIMIVPSDSINMVAEASSRSKPTLVYDWEIKSPKINYFLNDIFQKGMAKKFNIDYYPDFLPKNRLDEISDVAQKVRSILKHDVLFSFEH
jgi:mitochondrial fission protein ELM1